MSHLRLSHQRGQSLPIVVLMLAVIFLVIGLGVDGGLLYTQRRLMQNTADAACLAAANELALGRTTVDAQAAAVEIIQQNLGPSGPGTGANAPGTLSYTAIADVYGPNAGAGASLSRGIEVGVDAQGASPGPEVRVALSSSAFTYFMRVFAQPEYTVAAKARCDATAGGGGTPFAVARWRRYTGPQLDQLDYDLTTNLSIPAQLESSSNGHGNGNNSLAPNNSLSASGASFSAAGLSRGSQNNSAPAQGNGNNHTATPTTVGPTPTTGNGNGNGGGNGNGNNPTATTNPTAPASSPTATATSGNGNGNGGGNGGNGGGNGGGDVVRDILGAYEPGSGDPSVVDEWPGWGTNSYPGNPALETGLFSQPNTPASTSRPGIETIIAGQGSTPNRGGQSFRGAVLLDLRNVTFPNPEFYSGLTPDTSTNTYKDFVTRDILEGYGGPWIAPGTQLGFTDGVSAGQIERQFDMRYDEGQIVSVLVYNGTIYFKTDFTATTPSGRDELLARSTRASFTGDFPENCDASSYADAYIFEGDANGVGLDALEPYGLRITPEEENGNQSDPDPIDVTVRAFASVDGEDWNQLQAQWESSDKTSGWIGFTSQGLPADNDNFGISADGESLTIRLQQSETGTCEYNDPSQPPADPLDPTAPNQFVSDFPVKPMHGAMTVYLEAKDTLTGLRRGKYVRANLSVAPEDEDDEFYAYLPGEVVYSPVELDTSSTINLNQPMVFETVSGTLLDRGDVSVSFDWFTGSLNPTGAPGGISAAVNDVNGSPTLQIGVGPNATSGRDYYVRIAVTHGGKTQWVWYYLAVQPPMSNSRNISEYVYTLGYAMFRITDISSNSIEGEAVSGLLKPGELIAGRLPRLVPWTE
jgi:hypothetical protein